MRIVLFALVALARKWLISGGQKTKGIVRPPSLSLDAKASSSSQATSTGARKASKGLKVFPGKKERKKKTNDPAEMKGRTYVKASAADDATVSSLSFLLRASSLIDRVHREPSLLH